VNGNRTKANRRQVPPSVWSTIGRWFEVTNKEWVAVNVTGFWAIRRAVISAVPVIFFIRWTSSFRASGVSSMSAKRAPRRSISSVG
jgi:hypothetical protein